MNNPIKRQWYTLFYGFLSVAVIFCLLVNVIQPKTSPGMPGVMRPVCYVLAGLDLLLCTFWMRFKAHSGLAPAQFLSQTIVALAFANGCTIFGLLLFFLGAPQSEFYPFAFANIAADVLFILPQGSRYWMTR